MPYRAVYSCISLTSSTSKSRRNPLSESSGFLKDTLELAFWREYTEVTVFPGEVAVVETAVLVFPPASVPPVLLKFALGVPGDVFKAKLLVYRFPLEAGFSVYAVPALVTGV